MCIYYEYVNHLVKDKQREPTEFVDTISRAVCAAKRNKQRESGDKQTSITPKKKT